MGRIYFLPSKLRAGATEAVNVNFCRKQGPRAIFEILGVDSHRCRGFAVSHHSVYEGEKRGPCVKLIWLLLLISGGAQAENIQPKDWSFVEAGMIPVQNGGRIKPLDSFAREATLL